MTPPEGNPMCPHCHCKNARPYGYARDKVRRRYRCHNCNRTFHTDYLKQHHSDPGIGNEIWRRICSGDTYEKISKDLKVSSKTIAAMVRVKSQT